MSRYLEGRYRKPPVLRAVEYYMTANATETTISSPGVFKKVSGTTSEGTIRKGFTLSSNRATYNGPSAYFKVDAIADFTAGSNKEVALRIAKNGTTIASSQSKNTTSSGRAEAAHTQCFVLLSSGDYVEAWVANTTDTMNITVEDLSFTVAPA